ncbi:WhiB family transcriptional regulator [Streptomyces sp. NPDC037389]|uniref:WhiB family transcriptional regulator n=1 Tax=Streptomyces sp. NPDC037389 TaxID=3155369 RepID=UPI0033FA303C
MPLPIKISPPPYVPHSDDARLPCTTAPDLFFPPDRPERQKEQLERAAAAKALCFRCPVRTACGDWAREHQEFGIWGGRTEADHGYRPTTRRLTTRRTDPTEAAA